MILIIIKDGDLINQTLSTIKFDRYGTPTNKNFIICDTWSEGILKAKSLRYQFGLFVNSGTVFDDIDKFIEEILKYPHKGLIGHIIDPKDSNRFFYLDEQCFFLELDKFTLDDFTVSNFTSKLPERSEINIHDDYTPLWLKPIDGQEQDWRGVGFGEKILAKQLTDNIVVNWNNAFRNSKEFLYTDQAVTKWVDNQKGYVLQAEEQLWVFNNESIPLATESILLTPASGLCWILNLLSASVTHIDIIDISQTQLDLAKSLWNEWDGNNYGKFVSDFMQKNQVIHFNLDQPTISDLDRLKLRSPKHFIKTVNDIFYTQINIKDFSSQWQLAKKTKQVTFNHGDLVKFLPKYVEQSTTSFNLWVSNILEYKYTLIKNTKQDYDWFTFALNNAKVIRIHGQK